MGETYGQFCPVAMASEVLAERWTPLILRELLAGSSRFNDLRRGLPLISASLLSKRLKELERVGVVTRDGGDYAVTPAGEELRPVIEALGTWGQRWARGALDPERLDARLLLWDMRRRIDVASLPGRRVVVAMHVLGSIGRTERFWLVLAGGDADLCITDPGFEADVRLRSHVRDLVVYWTGQVTMEELVARGAVELEGPRELTNALPGWFLRSPFAEVELPA